MRYLNGLFCIVLLMFAVVQYNDPDGPLWALIYGVPAALSGLAAFDPARLRSGIMPTLLIACLALAVIGTLYYWPYGFAWWDGQVIWATEVVREGLGVLIMTIGVALVVIAGRVRPVAARSA